MLASGLIGRRAINREQASITDSGDLAISLSDIMPHTAKSLAARTADYSTIEPSSPSTRTLIRSPSS